MCIALFCCAVFRFAYVCNAVCLCVAGCVCVILTTGGTVLSPSD